MDNIEQLHEVSIIRVSSRTLLKHSKYNGDWNRILLDGWGYNNRLDKFYKNIRNARQTPCSLCNGTGVYEYETGIVDGPYTETQKEDCICTFRQSPTVSVKPQLIPFIQWN